MAVAEEFVQFVQPIVRKDSRFTNIALHPFTGSGGSLSVSGELLSDKDAQDLKRIIETNKPPVTVIYRVVVIPLELQEEIKKADQKALK